jgi:hypothetical protein
VRELLEVLQAAGLRQLEPGHLSHGRRRQLLLPPVSSPQPAPRQGGSGGREGAGRRQRGDVEQQRLGEATICACMDPSIQEGKRRKAPVRSREPDARREPADVARPAALVSPLAIARGCSAPERGESETHGDGWK